MNSHESGSVLAFQAETDVEHQALIRLCSILSKPQIRLPAPEWDTPGLDGLDDESDREALVIPDGAEL